MERAAYLRIDSRKQAVKEHLSSCRLCPRQCKVNRFLGGTGFCGLDDRLYCFREMINPTEEQGLVPSHQMYFAGCNLKCRFCSVGEWNEKPMSVPIIKAESLPECIEKRKREGAINLNLLGGEPSVSVYGLLELLENVPFETSVVWNSNMYFSEPVRGSIDGLIDVFLADYKCSGSQCSGNILGANDYDHIVRANIQWASQRARVLIRHVALPGHLECCSKPILKWIAEAVPSARVSLRSDYIPPLPAGNCPPGYLSTEEHLELLKLAKHFGLQTV